MVKDSPIPLSSRLSSPDLTEDLDEYHHHEKGVRDRVHDSKSDDHHDSHHKHDHKAESSLATEDDFDDAFGYEIARQELTIKFAKLNSVEEKVKLLCLNRKIRYSDQVALINFIF